MGLGLGLLPGIGGIAGTAMLLPFTYGLDPHAAFALLLGLGATRTTADPISAIVFGVPGHAASAATTLDGYPLTRKGQAGRALGASAKIIPVIVCAGGMLFCALTLANDVFGRSPDAARAGAPGILPGATGQQKMH